ncbi:MAG: ABC transporter permease [Peptococcaceae bacterium]|nr:ABC transporter permease [Peptococcaceae bacterium]
MKKSLSISVKDISTEHSKFLSRIQREKRFIRLWQWSLLFLIFALWEWAARVNLIDSFITSQPSRIWATLVNLYLNGDLWRHIGLTLGETLAGFLSGTLLGALIAMALWWLPFAAKVLDPYLVILNALPKIAMGPILIVWIGNGPFAIVAMALLVSIIVTVISVYTGFIQTDTDKIYLLRAFGATKWKVFTKVVLPSNMANLVSALKINVGLSWVGVIVGEFLVSSGGLGYLIVYGGQVFQLDLVMASVIILCFLAALMYQSVLWVEKAMYRWRSG